jgi:DNA (cytosine-5)-methyltransferase 1
VLHIDLYSGIGGFALACRWLGIETILFCENDKFCQQVLNKHWPDVPVVEDVNDYEEIKRIVTDTASQRYEGHRGKYGLREGLQKKQTGGGDYLLTAGFPCQPFSQAGKRKGSNDNRYLWPQTLAVIESIRPDAIVLENVAGLLSMVFPGDEINVASQTTLFDNSDEEIADYNTICGRIDSDLKQAGYETVWLVIPACAVGAPHRRDRAWIVANCKNKGTVKGKWFTGIDARENKKWGNQRGGSSRTNGSKDEFVTNSELRGRLYGQSNIDTAEGIKQTQCDITEGIESHVLPDWRKNWYEVAAEFCRVDARVSNRVDRLKSLGNAIVPQVAYEIIKAILEAYNVAS